MRIDIFTCTFVFTIMTWKDIQQPTSNRFHPSHRVYSIDYKQMSSKSSYSDQISWRSIECFKSRYRTHRYSHMCIRRWAKLVLPHTTKELNCHKPPNRKRRPASAIVVVWWLALLFPYWYVLDRMSADGIPEVFWGFTQVICTSRLYQNKQLKQPLCFHTLCSCNQCFSSGCRNM
jgi:hypothetical protein